MARQVVHDIQQVRGVFAAALPIFYFFAQVTEAFLAVHDAGIEGNLVGDDGFADRFAEQFVEARVL